MIIFNLNVKLYLHTLERGWRIGISRWIMSSGSPASISRDGKRGVAGGVFNLDIYISESISYYYLIT